MWKKNKATIIYSLGSSAHLLAGQEGGATLGNAGWITKNGISYLERVYSVYRNDVLKLGDANRLPSEQSSSLVPRRISGAPENGELSYYCAGSWASNKFCYGILAHELCNLFTGERVGSGWPTALGQIIAPLPHNDSKPSGRRCMAKYG